MRRLLRVSMLGLALGVAAAGHAPHADAQSEEDSGRARKAFKDAVALENAGKWAEALEKLEEAGASQMTAEIRLHQARAKEQLGRLVEALELARTAEEEALAQGADTAPFVELRGWLEARTPQLSITITGDSDGARLAIDGNDVGLDLIDDPVRVDPGEHRIVLVLAGGAEVAKRVTVDAGELAEIELAGPAGAGPRSSAPAKDEGERRRPEDGGGASPWPWVIGGVGVASLVASGVFFGLREQRVKELDDACREDVCPESVESKQQEAETFTTVSRITLGAGVVGVGVAAVLLLTRSSGSASRGTTGRRLHVSVGASPAAAGVGVGGRF